MSIETLSILEQLSRDKGIDKDILIDALKSAVEVAARKRYPAVKELQSEFNESTGEVEIYLEKTVVETVDLPDEHISLEDSLNSLCNSLTAGYLLRAATSTADFKASIRISLSIPLSRLSCSRMLSVSMLMVLCLNFND
jgi:hypothetical protein